MPIQNWQPPFLNEIAVHFRPPQDLNLLKKLETPNHLNASNHESNRSLVRCFHERCLKC